MGKCNNCGKQITLKEGEKNCPNCGKPPYICWNCQTDITGETKECPVCHFFICPSPSCSKCGKECMIPELILVTKGLKRRETIEKIYESITAPKRKSCPKGIPISYAHSKLRNMALRLQGFLTSDLEDKEEFALRFDKIIQYPIGKTWTINQEREDGQYGIELREVSNLAICMGKAKKEKIVKRNSDGLIIKEYEQYERIEKDNCKSMNWDNLLVRYCKKCKKTFDKEVKYCPTCIYSKGDKKGQPYILVERASHINFCSLGRKDFIQKGKIN